ncbi:MAG: hypothetical protein Q7U87_04860, partial [bacterium]|nr:hypothetical protein [bacterium]
MPKNISRVILAAFLVTLITNANAATATWDTLFCDDFSTEKGWSVTDPFVQSPYWHRDTLGAYSGYSFWCGTKTDTVGWVNPPGYGNGWAQFLTSPQFDLTGVTSDSVLLSLWHHYNLEAPGGGDWDCINVWIDSTGDATWYMPKWSILNPDLGRYPAAAYNLTDAYSWKYIGLAPDWQTIPGWGGTNGGWNKVGFDLTPYKGKKVRVCFVSCSDAAESDMDGGPYQGMWYFDNISLDTVSAGGSQTPIFFDNLDTDTLIPWLSQSKTPAYFWRKDDVAGNKFWTACPDSSVEYTWNQRDGLVSPFITIPGAADSCYVDFNLQFPDPMTMEGGHDNYNFEISQDSGKNWVPLSVYIPINQYADSWKAYSSIYGYTYLLGWLGKTVQFRISFYSDGDSLIGAAFSVD